MSKFFGVVPPVVTPLNDDFSVDYASYTRVLEYLIDGGCHGLFALGSTSEVVFYDDAERRKILEHTVKVANGRVPVIAGVIDPTTDRVIRHARDGKVGRRRRRRRHRSVLHPAPARPRRIDHFRMIRDAVDVPLIAYDIPVCVHTKLARQTVVTLANEGTIIGLKDSSGDDGNFRYALSDLAGNKDVFLMTGSEIVVDNALMMGAHGVVPGLANVDPAGYVRLWDAAQTRRLGRRPQGAGAALPPVRDRLGRVRPRQRRRHRRRRLQDRHAQPRRHRHQRHGPSARAAQRRRGSQGRRDPALGRPAQLRGLR